MSSSEAAKRFRDISLKNKIFFSIIAVILIISAVIALLARWILVDNLIDELELRGIAIARTIAERSSGYILDKNYPELLSLIFDEAKLKERQHLVSYIFVSDREDQVLSHTLTRPFPESLRLANRVPPDEAKSVRLFRIGDQMAYDIAIPITQGIYRIGTVHVGLNKDHIDQLVGKLRTTFLGFLSLVVVIIFVITHRIAKYITMPIFKLTQISDELSKGNFDVKLDAEQGDGCRAAAGMPGLRQPRCALPAPGWGAGRRGCRRWDFRHRSRVPGLPVLPAPKGRRGGPAGGRLLQHDLEHPALPAPPARIRKEIPLPLRQRPGPHLRRQPPDLRHHRRQPAGRGGLRVQPGGADRQGLHGAGPRAHARVLSIAPGPGGSPRAGHLPQGAALQERPHAFLRQPACQQHRLQGPAGHRAGLHRHHRDDRKGRPADPGEQDEVSRRNVGRHRPRVEPAAQRHQDGQRFPGHDGRAAARDPAAGPAPGGHRDERPGRPGGRDHQHPALLRPQGRTGHGAGGHQQAHPGGFSLVGRQFELENIRMELDLGQGIPAIMAHDNRLQQVFFNLVTNARDAISEKKGRLPGRPAGKILIRTYQEGGQVVAEVEDDGIGISDAVRDKIFEPFFSTKESSIDMGLGLAITYGIVKDYGGDDSADEPGGRGHYLQAQFCRR
ncbi:MAG: ATP-binding protein [Desulfobacterales bacterium]|nr:ATP-binding protein [Desulfobacterales bacterium]